MTRQEKLLHVFYQDERDRETIDEHIHSVERLDEIIEIEKTSVVHPEISNALYINENRIHILPDWLDKRPGILFHTEIPFNKRYFLGVVFGLLGNEEKYPQYFTDFPAMLFAFDLMHAITNASEADAALERVLGRTSFSHPFENYIFNHNVAIALNYGHFSNEINAEAIAAHYEDAMQLAFEPSYKVYTLKFYATFLTDCNDSTTAMQLIDQQSFKNIGDYQQFMLERVWCQAAINQLQNRRDESFLNQLKKRLWDTVQFYDKRQHRTIASLLWIDAAKVAIDSNSFAEAMGYINKAIQYLKAEGQSEMLAQAQMVRGQLFHYWAQSGNPQFYRTALEAYHEALVVFKKEDAPDVFADIHHQLGVIYAEMPEENKKKSIWAALSATSFNESLEYYNKVDFPGQFAMICNNYANAFTKYPSAIKSNNLEKALNYYNEALSVRTSAAYPEDRAVTLLNYLETSWKIGNPDEDFNWERYYDMCEKANEIKTLTHTRQFIEEAEKHLHLLHVLEKQITTAARQ